MQQLVPDSLFVLHLSPLFLIFFIYQHLNVLQSSQHNLFIGYHISISNLLHKCFSKCFSSVSLASKHIYELNSYCPLLWSPKENYSWMRDQIKCDLNVTIKTSARYQETSPCLGFLGLHSWNRVTRCPTLCSIIFIPYPACAIETISHILICSNLQKSM